MLTPLGLAESQRRHFRADLTARMQSATSTEWRVLWESEILFLDGRDPDALEKLHSLTHAPNNEIAVAANISIGQWYERAQDFENALRFFRTAATLQGGQIDVQVLVHVARVFNEINRPELAIETLSVLTTNMTSVPDSMIQFVIVEYVVALKKSHAWNEARGFVDHVIETFPNRKDLGVICHNVLDGEN